MPSSALSHRSLTPCPDLPCIAPLPRRGVQQLLQLGDQLSAMNQCSVKSGFPQLMKLTFPYVRRALWSPRSRLIALLIASVALGVVPTLKSELESGVIDQINFSIHG